MPTTVDCARIQGWWTHCSRWLHKGSCNQTLNTWEKKGGSRKGLIRKELCRCKVWSDRYFRNTTLRDSHKRRIQDRVKRSRPSHMTNAYLGMRLSEDTWNFKAVFGRKKKCSGDWRVKHFRILASMNGTQKTTIFKWERVERICWAQAKLC